MLMLYIFIGLFAGICGGFFGIGGGIVIIPLLSCLLGYSQKLSQGTTLGVMLVPVALPAVISYWKNNYVDTKAVSFIALGFFVGGYIGSTLVQYLSDNVLRKIFAVMLIVIAIRMLVRNC